MKKMITFRDIAAQAGVSVSSVSLALREHPSLPQKTRCRIQAVAQALGYRPNPLVSALMTSLRNPGKSRINANLALIYPSKAKRKDRLHSGSQEIHAFAQNQAQRYGYQLTEVCLETAAKSHKNVAHLLQARNAVGLLVDDRDGQFLSDKNFPWDTFSTVRIGFASALLRVHTVTADHFRIMTTAIEALIVRGYRRIGLDLPQWCALTDYRYEAAFYRQQHLHGSARLCGPFRDNKPGSPEVLRWALREKLDALITPDIQLLHLCQKMGIRVPDQLALAHTDVTPVSMPGWAGVGQDRQTLVNAAIDLLVSECNHSHRGLPAHPFVISVPGHWVQGASVASRL